MALIWVIAGTGRGVGKTHLAMKLREALPLSVYAKGGHGSMKADRDPHFFNSPAKLDAFVRRESARHQHVIVESNAWAKEARGTLILFLEATGHSDPRKDAAVLRRNAHIRVGPQGSIRGWSSVLRRSLPDPKPRKAVMDLLVDQKRRLSQGGLAVRTKVWFATGDLHVFGNGLARLLSLVKEHRSLRTAAQTAGMSYRYAWDRIKKAEKHLGKRILSLHPGGVGGGNAELTADGQNLLEVYLRVSREVARFADRRFEAGYRLIHAK